MDSIFITYIAGEICGDKCTGFNYESGYCYCGNDEKFGPNDGYYCCTPNNVTCNEKTGIDKKGDVECPEGKKLPWNTFCENQGQCPFSVASIIAVESNCSNFGNIHCPESNRYSSKICLDDTPLNIEDYCLNGRDCKQAAGGFDYQQCHNEFW